MLNANQNTSQNTSASKIERVAVVTPQLRIWTGETVLRKEDIHLGKGGSLPDRSFASLGRKALIKPERLLVFRKIRDAFRRECSSIGVNFLGGFAIDVEKFSDLKPKLDGLVSEFEAEVDKLCYEYPTLVEEWKRANPQYAIALERDGKAVGDVRSRFTASYIVNKIQSVDGEEAALEKQVDGLYETLLADIRKDSSEYLKKSLQAVASKAEISQKARSVVRRIVKKLESLSFLNSKTIQLAEAVKAADAKLPRQGFLRQDDFWRLFAIMSVLADENLTEGVIEGTMSIESLCSQYAPQVSTVVTPLAPVEAPAKVAETVVDEDSETGDLFDLEPVAEIATNEVKTEPEPQIEVAEDVEPEAEPEPEPQVEPMSEPQPVEEDWNQGMGGWF